MPIAKDSVPIQNRLLGALPASEYQRLVPHLELVTLPLHQVLYEPNEPITHVYFPHQAVISLITTMEDGSTIEVGLVGSEGMVGLPVILGGNITNNQAFVQIPDAGMRMDANIFKTEFHRGGELQRLLLRYCQALLTQVSQSAACNRFHTIEERLARWMLLVQDCVDLEEFPLTQQFIAEMLGTRRSGVTVAAGTLQQAGMLRYTRGKITIVNREALEATACECYRVISDEFSRLLS
ncbi:Crp/Fnr family transcriptional regulator [Mastigocladopsis repens]|uniref:Crp/Fnr family transcriptional regulator n=1 Tax=Mastigocladopsis repens TaxID=221287 RepID=UPI0002FDB75E|nr:Crp/Fnr family transcriptional regulator [Mastigocladopsis repens]